MVNLGVSVPKVLRDEIDKKAAEVYKSRSEFTREALVKLLAQYDEV